MDFIRLNLAIGRDILKDLPSFLRLYTLTLKEVVNEGEDIKTFIFTSNKPIRFKAGQYSAWFMKQFIKGKPNHLFTIASAPSDNEYYLSTRISKSDYKQKLNKLKPGQQMLITGGIGQFTLPKKSPDRAVFIAGGIGITPFRALARRVKHHQLPVATTLIHSGRNFYLYKDELSQLVDKAVFTTRKTFEEDLTQAIKDNGTKKATYYVSGPPAFVNSASKILKQNKVKNIKRDGFLGY